MTLKKIKLKPNLSIKYGISLNEDRDYIRFDNKKIWDHTKNKIYNHNVTGIGKEDFYHLNQKQSGNSAEKGLYLGLGTLKKSNFYNENELPNQTYMLWGDNNKSTVLHSSKSGDLISKMERIWKIQTTSKDSAAHFKNTTTQIFISKKEMPLEKDQNVLKSEGTNFWFVIDSSSTESINYTSAKYIKSSENTEDKLVFDNVNWVENTSNLFTIVKAPDFFMLYDVVPPICDLNNKGKIKIKIVGGNSPYTVHLQSDKFDKKIIVNEDFLTIDDLVNGSYTIEVSDNIKTQKGTFIIDDFNKEFIQMEALYYLNDDSFVSIEPILKDHMHFGFEWLLDGVRISDESKLNVEVEGDYVLIATNDFGCKKEYPFRVNHKTKSINGSWVLYPDPIRKGDHFTIHFELKEKTEVTITISEISGKIVKSKNLGYIKDFNYTETLLTTGTYIVTVSQNGIKETTKLLVN